MFKFNICILLVLSENFLYIKSKTVELKDHTSLLATCTNKILISSIKDLIIIYNSTYKHNYEDYLDNLFTFQKKPAVIFDVYSKHDQLLKFYNSENQYLYIIFLINTEEIKNLIHLIYGTLMWNPKSNYLIIYFGDEDIKEIFNIAWAKYIINIIVLYRNNKHINIATYFPYKNMSKNIHCGGNTNMDVLYNNCNEQNITFQNLFPDKIPSNMNGCIVKTMAGLIQPIVKDPFILTDNAGTAGFEVALVNSFTSFMNMTRNVSTSRNVFGNRQPNGSYTGVLKYAAEDLQDIVFGSIFPNGSYLELEGTKFHSQLYVVWVVPAALPEAQWKSVISIFTFDVWVLVLIIQIIVAVLIWIISLCYFDLKLYTEFCLCLLYSLYILLLGSVSLPKSLIFRILILSWVLTSLLLVTAYQSQLVSFLFTPRTMRQISSREELVQSTINIYFNGDYFNKYNSSGHYIDQKLCQRAQILSNEMQVKLRDTFQENSAFLINRNTMKYHISKNNDFYNSDGSIKVYLFKKHDLENPITFFVKKGYPLLNKFNKMLSKFEANGIKSKWEKDGEFFFQRPVHDSGPKKLHVYHLLSAFIILASGYTLSCIIFVTEYLFA